MNQKNSQLIYFCNKMSYLLNGVIGQLSGFIRDASMDGAQKQALAGLLYVTANEFNELCYTPDDDISYYHCGRCKEDMCLSLKCPICGLSDTVGDVKETCNCPICRLSDINHEEIKK